MNETYSESQSVDAEVASTPDVVVDGARVSKLSQTILPDGLSLLLARPDLNDRSIVLCLEAIMLSLKKDGTAVIGDVAHRYHVRAAASQHANAADRNSGLRDRSAISGDLEHSLLPRLAHAKIIALPADGRIVPEALITIANPWLRLALLEAGADLMAMERPLPMEPAAGPKVAMKVADRKGMMDNADSRTDWSQIWFAAKRSNWRALAVVPANPNESALSAATALAEAGSLYQANELELIDSSNAEPRGVEALIANINAMTARNSQVIVAVDSPMANPAAIPIVRGMGAAILCVQLGVSSTAQAKQTMASIGKNLFIGSVTLRRN